MTVYLDQVSVQQTRVSGAAATSSVAAETSLFTYPSADVFFNSDIRGADLVDFFQRLEPLIPHAISMRFNTHDSLSGSFWWANTASIELPDDIRPPGVPLMWYLSTARTHNTIPYEYEQGTPDPRRTLFQYRLDDGPWSDYYRLSNGQKHYDASDSSDASKRKSRFHYGIAPIKNKSGRVLTVRVGLLTPGVSRVRVAASILMVGFP